MKHKNHKKQRILKLKNLIILELEDIGLSHAGAIEIYDTNKSQFKQWFKNIKRKDITPSFYTFSNDEELEGWNGALGWLYESFTQFGNIEENHSGTTNYFIQYMRSKEDDDMFI